MNAINERTRSFWMAEMPRPAPALTRSVETEVVVVGAASVG